MRIELGNGGRKKRTEGCFTCGSLNHIARDCNKNSRRDGGINIFLNMSFFLIKLLTQVATTTIEEAEVDLMTEKEGIPAQMIAIEREIISMIEEENPLEKIDIPTEETPQLTEDAAALDQILEIKTVALMKIKEEALINMNLPTMASETEETKDDMSANQETPLQQVISPNTTKETQQIAANSATVSPTVDPTITAQIPDTPHPDKTVITELTIQVTISSHAVTPDEIFSLCVSLSWLK